MANNIFDGSISATELAKIGKCEQLISSPLIKMKHRKFSREERVKIDKGNAEHNAFEKQCAQHMKKQPRGCSLDTWVKVVLAILTVICIVVFFIFFE